VLVRQQKRVSDQIGRQARLDKESFKSVDLAMSVVKPLGATWLIALHTYLKDNPNISINGYKEAGILF
jgi:uncharacterized protein YfaQ (DUF2300 family)